MVKVGRTKTKLHSALSERDQDAKSHPAIYLTQPTIEAGIDAKIATHTAVPAAHHTKTTSASELTTGTLAEPRVAASIARDSEVTAEIAAHAAIAAAHHAKGIASVKIGSFTRNASGSHSVTGVGFQPKIVLFLATTIGGTHQILSIGWDDATTHHCIYAMGHQVDTARGTSNSISVFKDASNYIIGAISSMGADGFTISWTKVGTVEAVVTFLAMK